MCRLREATLYAVHCDRCDRDIIDHRGDAFGPTYMGFEAAHDLATAHEKEHERRDAVGPTLVGLVFATNAQKVWYGIISAAAEAAVKAGYPYFTWNGQVYTSISPNLRAPICHADEVPGLIDH